MLRSIYTKHESRIARRRVTPCDTNRIDPNFGRTTPHDAKFMFCVNRVPFLNSPLSPRDTWPPPELKFVPKGECSSLRSPPGVNTFYCFEEWRVKQRISPLGGQNSPLGDNFATGGKSLPLVAKLRLCLRPQQDLHKSWFGWFEKRSAGFQCSSPPSCIRNWISWSKGSSSNLETWKLLTGAAQESGWPDWANYRLLGDWVTFLTPALHPSTLHNDCRVTRRVCEKTIQSVAQDIFVKINA
jgi:hypothetical protein